MVKGHAHVVQVIVEFHLLLGHDGEQRLESNDQASKNNGTPIFTLSFVKAARMDNSHLLKHC